MWNRRDTVIILLPDISNGTFPKKLKPDNMKEIIGATMHWGTLSWSEILTASFSLALVIGSFVLCYITCNYVSFWLYFELVRSLVYC